MNNFFFYQWETIEWTIQIQSEDGSPVLDGYKDVIVSLSQGDVLIEKDSTALGIDTGADTISYALSQEDTSRFIVGTALLQVNVYYEDSTRDTSCMADIQVKRNLHKAVMT